jgi:drug/metabolite transporter (DMT)-like permease
MKNKKLLGNAILIFTAAIWGLGFAWQRMGMEDIGPVTFTAAREIISAVFIGAAAVIINTIRRGKERIRTGPFSSDALQTVKGGICCGTVLVAATLFQQMGIVYTSAGKAGFITAMYMLFVPIISFIVLRRKSPWIVWLAVVIGIVGMYLLCVNERLSFTKGDVMMLVCAVLYSCHILCCDHFAKQGDPITISAIQFATASVISTVLAFIVEEPALGPVLAAIAPILYCGFVSGGLGYTSQMIGQKYADPAPASIIMSFESVFAVLGGAFMLHERMSMREAIGCVIMFAAIILVQIPAISSPRQE